MRQMIRLLAAACVWLFAAGAAHSLTITTASLGGNQVCTTLACATQTHTFGSSSAVGSGGSITLSGTTLTFSISAGSASFNSVGADPNLSLSGLSVTGTATVMAVAGNYVILSGSGSVSGSANSSAFTASLSQVGGTCTTVGGGLSCGITLSYLSSTPFGSSRAFLETVNLQAPEPNSAALVAVAVGALAFVSRRRR
jgi:MYXO-CTERM domain-containing protein